MLVKEAAEHEEDDGLSLPQRDPVVLSWSHIGCSVPQVSPDACQSLQVHACKF